MRHRLFPKSEKKFHQNFEEHLYGLYYANADLRIFIHNGLRVYSDICNGWLKFVKTQFVFSFMEHVHRVSMFVFS
jgi:hypothetical protein